MASMEITTIPKVSEPISGPLPTIGFPQFAKLPVELQIRIWEEVHHKERVLRLDLGVDSLSTNLLHVCRESRAVTQRQFTTHRGEIYSDGTAFGTVATPPVKFQIWINKNGRDILHLTPLYRPSFPSTQSVPVDPADPSSFAVTNFKAMDELVCVRPEGGKPFENLNRVMVETGRNQLQHLGAEGRLEELEKWSSLYAGLVVKNKPEEKYAVRLGINLSELFVVWRNREFDATRVDLQYLGERARCVMPAKQTHCEQLNCPSEHVFLYEEGRICRRLLLHPYVDSVLRSIAGSFTATMKLYHDAVRNGEFGPTPVQLRWPDIVLLG
ncbi:hypothetical protein VTL71DRAFT_10154 [Oculimacula yallundae]|uniref:2EXR domain-containing protein n=1 Tax=Oculimacula yallundae TaxID=86028 RepID=A0ABR4BPR7_9HELO